MVAVMLMSVLAVAGVCVLAYTLTVYALPFMLGVTAAQFAYHTGAGFIGAGLVGFVAALAALGVLALLFDTLCSPIQRVIVGLVYVKRKGLPARPLLDVVAPAIPVAQAVGRLGNWFNQELFGRPTSLPWGLKVDADKVPAGYSPTDTFHPTFLYEALWNLALAGALVLGALG